MNGDNRKFRKWISNIIIIVFILVFITCFIWALLFKMVPYKIEIILVLSGVILAYYLFSEQNQDFILEQKQAGIITGSHSKNTLKRKWYFIGMFIYGFIFRYFDNKTLLGIAKEIFKQIKKLFWFS